MEEIIEEIIVQIRRNADGKELTIVPHHIDLLDGQWVHWEFVDLVEEELGFVFFPPPAPRLGPFFSLRSYTNAAVLGKGNKGQGEVEYPYTAMILVPGGPGPVASGTGTLHNQTSQVDTTPEVVVTYRQGPDGTLALDVRPDPVGLNTGDTATWNVVGLPGDAFACFHFDTVQPGTNEAFGPFVAFSATPGEGFVAVQASGTGFGALFNRHQPPPQQFTYRIEVRNSKGDLLASHEPIIDNLGPPAPLGRTFSPRSGLAGRAPSGGPGAPDRPAAARTRRA